MDRDPHQVYSHDLENPFRAPQVDLDEGPSESRQFWRRVAWAGLAMAVIGFFAACTIMFTLAAVSASAGRAELNCFLGVPIFITILGVVFAVVGGAFALVSR